MKLIDIIYALKDLDKAQAFLNSTIPGLYFDQAELFMAGKISIDSEIRIFDAEKIPDKILMEVDGIIFVNLFPLYLAQEMVESMAASNDRKYSDLDIAKRLIEYAINDA